MSAVIENIDINSPLHGRKIMVGDTLVRINGHKIKDVLDYKFYSYETRLLLEIHDQNGKIKLIRVEKPEGLELGLTFQTYLIDNPRACANQCVFCFVDQLPVGLRDTLYFKDDDVRLSFLQGNYVTLTNLSEREIQRIIDMRLSPLNISVHSTDAELHSLLLGHKKSARGLNALKRFMQAGIQMNCQIVCCPGLNDGEQLDRSMEDLALMYPAIQSVSIVPVGLTKYREGLFELRPFDKELARKTVLQIERFGEECVKKYGTRLFYPADELYLKADFEIPIEDFYEEYPQLENGVGMLRLLLTEAEAALLEPIMSEPVPFSIATGEAACRYLQKVFDFAEKTCAIMKGSIYAVKNDFFGDMIDVAGLITGGDLIRQLKGKDLGKRLLITKNMLRHGDNVFLDDVTLQEVSEALGVEIRVVNQDGADLIRAMFGN